MVDRTGPTDLYRQYDKDENLLYIGISINARARHVQHKVSSEWVAEVATIRIENYSTRADAEKAEREAIANERPLYNSQHATYKRPKPIYVPATPRVLTDGAWKKVVYAGDDVDVSEYLDACRAVVRARDMTPERVAKVCWPDDTLICHGARLPERTERDLAAYGTTIVLI